MDGRDALPSIHQRIASTLAELGLADARCHETKILLQNGYCKGRQFGYDGLRVVWLLEEAVLEFYDSEGELLKRLALDEQLPARRLAA